MTVVVLAALGTALALTGIMAGLRRRVVSPQTVLEAVHRPAAAISPMSGLGSETSSDGSRWRIPRPDNVVSRQVVEVIERRGLLPDEIRGWLTTTDRSLEEVMGQIILGALAALVVPLAVVAVTEPMGIHVPVVLPLWVAAAIVVVAAVAPIVSLRSEALMARRAARAVVAMLLDLVVLCLAGGMGVEGALYASASIADDPVAARLRQGLLRARDTGETPWQALSTLGRELRIEELCELSAAIGLAGTEGARVRATLSAKASSIRRHQLADAEAEANTITERLFLPGMFLLLGFLLFVGYPAVARILSGF